MCQHSPYAYRHYFCGGQRLQQQHHSGLLWSAFGQLTGSFTSNPIAPGNGSTANVNVGNLNVGSYNFDITGSASGVSQKKLAVSVSVIDKPGAVSLTTPANGATGVALKPTLSWSAQASAASYRVEVATDSGFSNIVASGTVSSGTNYQPSSNLNSDTTYYWRVRADNGCGQAWSSVASFTTVDAAAGSVLQNGVAKTNLSGANNSSNNKFTFEVPANARNLKFVMTGGSGDADLHVKFGQEATTSTYDCRPYRSGNAETCNISNVQTGTYHVMIHGYSAFSGVSLTASYDEGSTGGGGIDESNLSGAADSKKFYTIDVASGTSKLTVTMSGGSGDADLYVRRNNKPTENNYKCRPYKNGNNETCNINNPGAGTWHIGVFGYSSYSGVNLKATTE